MIHPLRFILILALAALFSCRSSDSSKEGTPGGSSESKSGPAPGMPEGRGTSIKANFSAATVIVDSIVILDSVRYTAYVYIKNVKPSEAMPSFAEADQHITASPEYLKGADGSVDPENERNRNLLALRGARAGDSLEVKISLLADGTWSLIGAGVR